MIKAQRTHPAGKTQRVMQSSLARLVAGFLIVAVPVALGQALIVSLPLGSLARGILAAGFSVPTALGAYYILVHYIERREMTELSLPGAVWETAAGMLLGALLLGGILAILALAGAYQVTGINSPAVLLAPLFFALSSTVAEEILFRGVLFRLVERGLGQWAALAISAAVFGGLHVTNENATIIGALAIMLQAGVVLGAAFLLTRRLWLPMGIHFAVNFLQAGIVGAAVSGNRATQGLLRGELSGPEWLTGGAFGVEASLLTVLTGLVLSVLFLWLARKRERLSQGGGPG